MEMLNPVDVHVGARVRATRVFRNFELWELAAAVGIPSARLIQYEAGQARCLPEHLVAIARKLNVRGSFFFEGMRDKAKTRRAVFLGKNPEIVHLWLVAVSSG